MSATAPPPPASRTRPARGAFTLIELLVVITVIAILASMLLPTLRAVRRTARNTKCLHNVRELGHVLTLYLEDSRDMCPPWIRHCKCDPPHGNGWWTSIHYLVQVYLDDATKLWECPSDDSNDCTPWDGQGHNGSDWYEADRRRCGYLYNNGGGSYYNRTPEDGLSISYSEGRLLDEIANPSKKIAAFCWCGHNFWPGAGPGRERMQWWHSDRPVFKLPLAFVDSHAEFTTLIPCQSETAQYRW